MKFPFCETCAHVEDQMVCDECESGEGYELDESLFQLGDDGFWAIKGCTKGVPELEAA